MPRQFLTKIAFSIGILMLFSAVVVAFGALVPEAAYADNKSAVVSTGSSKTGWQKENGKWYYYDTFGRMVSSTAYTIGTKTYLFSKSGALVTKTGWQSIYYGETQWYYVKNSNGEVYKGWKQEDGKWYYLYESNGQMASNSTVSDNNKTYMFSSSGALVTKVGWRGIKQDNGTTSWYYVKNSNGELYKGWLKDGGKWYYLNKDIAKMECENTEVVDGTRYLFSESGALVTKTGWKSIKHYWGSTSWHYVKNSNGEVYTGWLKDGGKWYYFNDEGWMTSNTTMPIGTKLYLFSESGALVTKTGWHGIKDFNYTEWYYVKNSNGELYTGWLKQGNTWYYLRKETGKLCNWDGNEKINGKQYLFLGSGALVTKTGWYSIKRSNYTDWYYIKNSNGELQIGWKKDGGKWYYFDTEGRMLASTTRTIDGKEYTFAEDGHML